MQGDFEKLASHDKYYKPLIDLLKSRTSGKIGNNDISMAVAQVISKKMDSAQTLDFLASVVSKNSGDKKRGNDEYEVARKQARIRDIEKYSALIDKNSIDTYLDVGCGDGSITAAIGHSLFKLKKDNIIGIDVDEWAGHEHASSVDDSITFRKIETPGVFPVESHVIDIMTINMVLHHVPYEAMEQTMSEIVRCLKPTGTIFLRDHDSPNHMVDSLINIEHGIFEVALEQLSTGDKFQSTYYGKYRPMRDWVDLFGAFGFSPIGNAIVRKDKTRPFTVAFQKTKLDKNNITNMNASELRSYARNTGIIVQNSLPVNGVKRAIMAGRRK
jgi:2-polyprenyl-3-methyl-5-hydroxy-6-metoxy-1,4-benzoquinol methylase